MRVPRTAVAAALTRRPVSIIKTAAESRYVLGVAFAAGRRDDARKGADGRRDWMSPAEVEKAAWKFMDGPREIGVQHVDGTTGVATVVESFIWRGDPWTVIDTAGRRQTVNPGDWLVGAVLEPAAWELYKAGRVEGWSIQGKARHARSEQ